MAGLADLFPHCPAPEAVVAAIAGGCAAAWGVRFQAAGITPEEERAARELEEGRYRSEDWNGGRSRLNGLAGEGGATRFPLSR
jgi:lipoate-protein ligase A